MENSHFLILLNKIPFFALKTLHNSNIFFLLTHFLNFMLHTECQTNERWIFKLCCLKSFVLYSNNNGNCMAKIPFFALKTLHNSNIFFLLAHFLSVQHNYKLLWNIKTNCNTQKQFHFLSHLIILKEKNTDEKAF